MRWGENIVKVSLQLNLQKMPGRGSMQGFSCPLEERERDRERRRRDRKITFYPLLLYKPLTQND